MDPAGELTALPSSLASLRGPTSKGRGEEGKEINMKREGVERGA